MCGTTSWIMPEGSEEIQLHQAAGLRPWAALQEGW